MLQTKQPRCEGCKHFAEAAPDPQNLKAPSTGICFRHPPQIVVVAVPQGAQIHMMNPTVQAIHHCGEFDEGSRIDLGTIPFIRQ